MWNVVWYLQQKRYFISINANEPHYEVINGRVFVSVNVILKTIKDVSSIGDIAD